MSKIKIITLGVTALIMSIFMPIMTVQAVDFAVRAEAGYASYSRTLNGTTLDFSYPVGGFGGTLFMTDRLAFDTYVRAPLGETSTGGTYVGKPEKLLRRTELNAALSYAVIPNLSVFIGYRFFYAEMGEAKQSPNQYSYGAKGPTFGASYGMISDDRSMTHVLSAAYSLQQFGLDQGAIFNTPQDAFSTALVYKFAYLINDSWDASLGFDYYSIKTKGTTPATFEESTLASRMAIRYAF